MYHSDVPYPNAADKGKRPAVCKRFLGLTFIGKFGLDERKEVRIKK
jgi:hypothetical protein